MEKNLILFNAPDGVVSVNVMLEKDTLWLSQKQMAELFGKDTDTIGLHLKNIYKDGELSEVSTTEFFSVVQNEGNRSVTRKIMFYSLDAILSVGYRVSSIKGTQFRIWANKVLKDYLLRGYAVNHNLVDIKAKDIQMALDLLSKTLVNNRFVDEAGQSVINIINNYAQTWSTLLQYDEDKLQLPVSVHKQGRPLAYTDAISAISKLKDKLISINEATELFAKERGEQLQSILGNLEQTMFGEELYKSVEEKAANLLYMVIKDHPFSDGNKRTGSFLFLFYIQTNQLPLNIDQIGLTALTLLIAESDPNQKDLMIRLIVNLLVKEDKSE